MMNFHPTMTQTSTLMRMRVPEALHDIFIAILEHARWVRREEIFVVKSSRENLNSWHRFLAIAHPAIEVLNDVADQQCNAEKVEKAEAAALEAVKNARKSLSHAKYRVTCAGDRLEELAGLAPYFEAHAALATERAEALEAEVLKVEGDRRAAIAPALRLCESQGLERSLSELRDAWDGDDPAARLRAAQDKLRLLREALRGIGYRHRWVDALADFSVESSYEVIHLVFRARHSDPVRDIEMIATEHRSL